MKKITVDDIISILHEHISTINITLDQLDDDLTKYGMNSISFISIVVSLEEKFECEIPDSKLLISEMNTVNKIYEVLNTIERGDSFESDSKSGESNEQSVSK